MSQTHKCKPIVYGQCKHGRLLATCFLCAQEHSDKQKYVDGLATLKRIVEEMKEHERTCILRGVDVPMHRRR